MKACVCLPFLAASLAAQIPGGFTTFGAGCSGSAPHPSLSAATPRVGEEFVLTVRGLQPGSTTALLVGVSDVQWNRVPLPLDLSAFGASGCALLVSPDAIVPLINPAGVATFRLYIPSQPQLAGLGWFQQAWALEPGANPVGWAFSDGAKATIASPLDRVVFETFADARMHDTAVSGGTWAGGRALPPRLGGAGELGSFDVRAGRLVAAQEYEWSTDSMVIPAQYSPTGLPITVTGGRFEFTDFHLPQGFVMRLVGSNPAQIRVAGDARIEGKIDASASRVGFFNATMTVNGQPGSPGGPGGGRGGAGGDRCPNTGPSVAYDGRDGETVRLVAGHAYTAQAQGTGGSGSGHWPRNGVNTVYCALSSTFASHTAGGGGGGGFHQAGGTGAVTATPCQLAGHAGVPAVGGARFDLLNLPAPIPGPSVSLDHFGVGGSGGGGAGSHPLLSRLAAADWVPGAAGGGGGGVVALRIGHDLRIDPGATIDVSGGAGPDIDGVSGGLFNVPAPGGGGSGGSILLQVVGSTTLLGLLDSSGGDGGLLDNKRAGQPALHAATSSGAGAPGYVRLETAAGATAAQVGRSVPAAVAGNAGRLTDAETFGISQSRFYFGGTATPPRFVRYEVDALVNNRPLLYSDDAGHPAPNFAGAATGGGPLRFEVQGARIDPASGRVLSTTPWRDYVFSTTRPSLDGDGANGWRFRLTFDTARQSVEVTRVSVWYR